VSLPSFQLLRPKTLDEAVRLMAKHDGEVKIVAGGTDLLPSMKQKLFTPPYVLDLRGVGELRGIRNVPGNGVEIGALTTLSTIEHSAIIRKDYPVLYEAVKTVAYQYCATWERWAAMCAWTRAACGTTSRCCGARVADFA